MHSMYLTPHQKQVLGGGRPFRVPLGMAPLEVGTSYRGGAARVAVVKRARRANVNFILVACGGLWCRCWDVLFNSRWICGESFISFCQLVHIGGHYHPSTSIQVIHSHCDNAERAAGHSQFLQHMTSHMSRPSAEETPQASETRSRVVDRGGRRGEGW